MYKYNVNSVKVLKVLHLKSYFKVQKYQNVNKVSKVLI